MAASIERGKLRAPCATCATEITKGDIRVAEPCNDGRIPGARLRYHHLECAIESMPRLVRDILVRDPGPIENPAALNRKLQQKIEALEAQAPAPVAAPAPARRGASPQVETLLVELDHDPDDHSVLAVLADALAQRGDPRGDLIAVDLALASGAGDAASLTSRRDELREQLAPRLVHMQGVTATWGIGFIRAVELHDHAHRALERISGLWQHPSLRFITELEVRGSILELLVADGPCAVRDLRVRLASGASLRRITQLLARLAYLERLELEDTDVPQLAHPTLRRLNVELVRCPILRPADLPSLIELQLDPPTVVSTPLAASSDETAELLRMLADNGWFGRLQRLGMGRATLDHAGIELVREELDGRRLQRLDVSQVTRPPDHDDALRALADEVVLPRTLPVAGSRIRHTTWGVGIVLRRFDGKLEIKFSDGVRTFREGAPSLEVC